MPQLENNVMELTALVMASVNPGILSYTIALVVVIGVSLSTILSPFEPTSMIETLNKTIEKTHIRYNEHKDMLDRSAGFDNRVKRLQVEAFKLKERHLQAYDDISLGDLNSWRHFMQETKGIWVKTRQHQGEIVELRKALELAIVRARRDELEAAFACHGQQGEEEGEELDESSNV